MTHDQIFEFANGFALLGWLPLIIAPRWKWTSKIVIGFVVLILSLIYFYLFFKSLGFIEPSDFSSLRSVMAMFTNPGAVVMGWVHYLAFDLIVGWWITRDAQKESIGHLWIVPSLLLTFILGPLGLLSYLIVRTIKTRRYPV